MKSDTAVRLARAANLGGDHVASRKAVALMTSCSLLFAGMSFRNVAEAETPTEMKVIHVAIRAANASNQNPGTKRKPLQTIAKGIAMAKVARREGRASTVLVHPGTYRESLTLRGDSVAAGPEITIAASEGGKVVVSGSDIWKGWTETAGNIFTHSWPYNWGLAPLPENYENGPAGEELRNNPVIRRREMVFVNGKHLTQFLSLEEVLQTPSSFFVSEENNRIYVNPPKRTALNEARVDVAIRPKLLQVADIANVTIKNLVFKHANTVLPGSAVNLNNSSRIRLIGNDFVWNNWNGLSFFQVKNAVIAKNNADHNGVGGMVGVQGTDMLVKGNTTSFNNWRGSRGWDRNNHRRALDGNFIDWATGQKFFRLRNVSFVRHRSVGNITGGLWFDYDNQNVSVKRSLFKDNMTFGVFVEASQGPVKIERNAICDNETGVLANNSTRGSLRRNLVQGNIISQFFVGGRNGPRPVYNHKTGKTMQLLSSEWSIHRNTVVGFGDQRAVGTWLDKESWTAFSSTLRSNRNSWRNPGRHDLFEITGRKRLPLKGWRAHTGQDQDSSFSKSRAYCDRWHRRVATSS